MYRIVGSAGLALVLAGCRAAQTTVPAAVAPPAQQLQAGPVTVPSPAPSPGPAAAPVAAAPLDPASLPLVIKRGNPAVKAVALTIDDGPHPEFTPKILKILAAQQVKATFFVVGKLVAAHPELVRAERDAGHLVENHTYDHEELTSLSPEGVRKQLVRGSQVLESALGTAPQFFRPPCGKHDEQIERIARDLGLTTVMWSTYPGDQGELPAPRIYRGVVDHVQNGSLILLHDGVKQTLMALPEIISTLKKRGYAFQTVAEMARGLGAKAGG
jgi:peptidoglycan/xylan/chitin deacetylase (PgdA/CDA1 family)